MNWRARVPGSGNDAIHRQGFTVSDFLYGRARDVFVLALFWFTVALAVAELPEIVRSLIVILGQ